MASLALKRARAHGNQARIGAKLRTSCWWLAALLFGVAAPATASEPGAAAPAAAAFGSELLIATWFGVFGALYALYAHPPARWSRGPRTASPAEPARRVPHGLFAKKPPRPAPRVRAAAPEQAARRSRATPARKEPPEAPRPGLGATQAGEEAFSVAQAAAPSAPPPVAPGDPDPVRLCATLRAEGRFADAARVARAGLATDREPGPLLVELSRAEFGLGHVEMAIDVARDAHFASRSRESIEHLIRLLVATRRFVRGDGPALRRAATRHPHEPLLLHAAGVCEAMYGKACDAEGWLRAALALAPDEEMRAAIGRDLARLEETRPHL